MTNLRQWPAAEAQQLKTPPHALLPRIRQALGSHGCVLGQERLLHAAHGRRRKIDGRPGGAQRDLRPTRGMNHRQSLQLMSPSKCPKINQQLVFSRMIDSQALGVSLCSALSRMKSLLTSGPGSPSTLPDLSFVAPQKQALGGNALRCRTQASGSAVKKLLTFWAAVSNQPSFFPDRVS